MLLLDEPLSALDPFLRVRMREELKRLQRELGITFVHVTHSQDEAMALADAQALPESVHERALAEAASFAIRADVAEEITRLKTHLDEIARLLKQKTQPEGVGKRLDFLIQELHREANTLGSKASAIELTRISLDMKVLIEQMREQVQNLE